MNVANSGAVNTQTMASTSQTSVQKEMGKDAFLRILVTQMKNQDPMEPLKDTEFIGQMAQFSSLEQLTNLNTAMTQFIGSQGKQTLTEHAHLIGTTVNFEYEVDGELQSGQSVVKALSMKDGELMAELEQDNLIVPINAINRIEKQVAATNEQEIV